ncbi:Basic-leucine zipper [Gracilaria domingensis]|nr:Basic-leucine zipper [Gracilaria domingensis]
MSLKNAAGDTTVPRSDLDRYAPNSSLPLLVRMPNGEDHQVDMPSNASVKDLKTSIANLPWQPSGNDPQQQSLELEFGGETLNENETLSHYNIPEVYDHADGFLKTISDSGYLDPDKKVEALDKACAVVRGISRGEKDMQRLISAVFDDMNDDTPASPSAQPSLSAMRRSRISRIPSLNLGALNSFSADGKSTSKLFSPSAPPTPRQLMRTLSSLRPDLYDTQAAEKATSSLSLGNIANLANSVPSRLNESQNQGSGELKRGNTWFHDIMSSINTSLRDPRKGGASARDDHDDVEGDSEGEDGGGAEEGNTSTNPSAPHSHSTNPGGPIAFGDMLKQENSSSADNDRNKSSAATTKEDKPVSGPSSKVEGNTMNATMAAAEGQTTSKPNIESSSKPATPPKGDSKATETRETGQNSSEASNANLQTPQKQTTPSSGSNTIVPSRPISNQDKQVIGLTPERQPAGDEVKLPKKRGRKRKNPHLTEEERKAQRQAQNRESAKLSRIRRKNMTMEYEKRVNTLEGENENLRDTISGLEDRLQMLQNLLTITVQRRAIPQVHPSMIPPSTAAIGQGPHTRLNPAINPHMSMPTQAGIGSQAGLVSRVNAHALLGGQNVMARAGATSHAGMIHAQNALNTQRPLNANDALVGRTQALSGSRPLGPNAPPQSNSLTNYRYKNF